MSIENKIHFTAVYYLESQNPNMNPIAIRPELTPPDWAAWEDTGHGRIIRFSKILIDGQDLQGDPKDLSPQQIEIIDQNGQIFKLVKLTLAIFNEKLKNQVARGGEMNFTSDQELQNHYLKEDFQSIG